VIHGMTRLKTTNVPAPPDGPAKQVDLFIIGAGLNFPVQLTSEAVAALRRCEVVCSRLTEDNDDWLRRRLSVNVVSLREHYLSNRARQDNYDAATAQIINFTGRGKIAGYITPGSPTVFDSVAQGLVRAAAESDFRVQIIPGISAIDTVMCDVGHDVAGGLQIYDASWMVGHDIAIRNDVQCLLFQPGVFGTGYRANDTQPASALTGLRDFLLRFYPPTHVVHFVRSASSPSGTTHISPYALRDICSVSASDLAGASLFVPPCSVPVPDSDFYREFNRPVGQ
jgi:precorrin-3B methylase